MNNDPLFLSPASVIGTGDSANFHNKKAGLGWPSLYQRGWEHLSACHSLPSNCTHHLLIRWTLKHIFIADEHLQTSAPPFFWSGWKFRMCIWLSNLRLTPVSLRISSNILPCYILCDFTDLILIYLIWPYLIFHTLSYHIISYHIISYYIISYLTVFYLVIIMVIIISSTNSATAATRSRWSTTSGHGRELSLDPGRPRERR